MSRFARPALRLIVGPAAVAALAGFELRHGGLLVEVAVGWAVFMFCIVAIAAWGRFQLERDRRRLESLAGRRARGTR